MLPWLLCLALLAAVITLWVKTRLLQRAFDEITEGLAERLDEDTNTLLSLSTRDPHARRLASELNRQLRQLRAQRRRYQNGDRELKEAVTNISHDLRTPLTAIRGYLDLLEREDLSPAARRYLELIGDRAETMTRLTEELFRYSVIQSAEGLTLEPVDLRAAVEEAVAGFYAALTGRGIQPVITLPETPVVRQADRAALARVLGNILNNALKYSAGDLEIVLTCASPTPPPVWTRWRWAGCLTGSSPWRPPTAPLGWASPSPRRWWSRWAGPSARSITAGGSRCGRGLWRSKWFLIQNMPAFVLTLYASYSIMK